MLFILPRSWPLVGMVSLLALVAQQGSIAQTTQAAGPVGKLPDTAAGRCVAAFLEMLANPTPERVTAFETAYRSPKRLKETPMEDRIHRARDLHEQLGKLTLHEVVNVGTGAISVIADNELGDSIPLDFEFDAEQGGKLDAIRITLVAGPGSVLKPQKLTAERRQEIVQAVAKAVDENYVYPQSGRKMADTIREQLAAGYYDKIEDDSALARRLTDDMRATSNDRHLAVRLEPSTSRGPCGPGVADIAADNYAFRKVEVLPGNMGYVRLDAFVDGEEAQRTASAAMAFVAHCDALIFDLRYNHGGSAEAIRFLTSYLFDAPTHLNDMVDRDGKVAEEFWALASVPGRRFAPDLPVFVLTSSSTFSGGEEFCYNLQNLKRATIVGEKTGGGAHPVRAVRIDDRIVAAVPFMRACNPVSRTNWEGVGVQPDVPAQADEALDRAVELARKALTAKRGAATQ
jgi:hypothetical protein